MCDTYLGIASQCLDCDKLRRAERTYYSNVALKINAKLGGKNFSAGNIVPFPDTMIMGCDVHHPGPGDKGRPSIAAVRALACVCPSLLIPFGASSHLPLLLYVFICLCQSLSFISLPLSVSCILCGKLTH